MFADKKINVTHKLKCDFGWVEEIAFSHFPSMFSKGIFFKVVKTHNWVVN